MALAGSRRRDVFDGPEAEAQVRSLGLEPEWLLNAVHDGEIEARNCSALEPATAPGLRRWFAGIRSLTEQALAAGTGWVRTDSYGLPRILNRQTRVAVTFCNGDFGAGMPSLEPHAKSPRGPRSIFLVRSNVRQLALFGNGPVATPPPHEQITWWLLVYSAGDVIRAELSLPLAAGEDRRFSAWQTRIILDVPPLNSPVRVSDDHATDVEVTVKKRA